MAGEILPNSHVSVLNNLSSYLNELEEVMNTVDENRTTKSRSPGAVSSSRSRRQRQTLPAEKKQHRKQRRYFTKPTEQGFADIQNSHPEESRHDAVAHKVHRESPCKGGHYFTSPRYKNPHQRKVKKFQKGNESRVIDDEKCSEDSRDVVTMRVIQDEMKEMKDKLSAVVETLSNVADALVKTVTENDQPDLNGVSDLYETKKSMPQLYNGKSSQSDYQYDVKSRRRGQTGFCCFGLTPAKSSEGDSDYYKPHRSDHSQKYDKEKHRGPSISGDPILGETLSSDSRNSRRCQNISGCYLIHRLLNRVKLLFF